MRRAWLGFAALLGFAAPVAAQVAQDAAPAPSAAGTALARSPDKSIHVMLRVDGEGRPEYSIRTNDETIVDWSRLGFILADAPKLERNFELRGVGQMPERG